MNKSLLNSMLAVTALSISAWAQPPAPPVTEIKAYLALTDVQITSLQTIQQNLHTQLANTMQQIQAKQQTLNSQLTAGGTTAAVLGQELLDIQNLRNSVKTAETAAQSQALNVLTADQKTKLKTLTDAAALRHDIEEATGLGLIVPANGGPGGGPGVPGGRGPQGRGPQMMGMGRGRGQ